MARTRLPDSARVPIGLEVSEADAAQIDEVLARPEFAGWTRAEWCREIIRSALRYYVGDAPGSDPGRASAPVRPASPQPVSSSEPPVPAAAEPAPAAAEPAPAAAEPAPAAAEPSAQPECPHPLAARDYQTGTCAACGAILWD